MNNKTLSYTSVTDKLVNWTIMVYISADDVLANFAIDSLNQFRSAATAPGDKVVALFDPNDGDGKAFRYSFEIKKNARERNEEEEIKEAGLSFFEKEEIDAPNMADPKTLTDFVNGATKELVHPKAKTVYKRRDRNYCLILWGHGTELLLDQDPIKGKRYLTPAKLQRALEGTGFNENNKLDIVAFDACSMSMIELASALQGCVRFMIASQDEVPDVSFPYGKILEKLQGHGKDPKEVCRLIPKIYLQSFRDYRINSRNGAQEIMLSSLDLEEIKNITGPVSKLADLLLRSVGDEDLGNAIVEARKSSRDFVLGLFVDLSDFCEKMLKRLDKMLFQDKEYSKELENVLVQIRDAIKIRDATGTGKYVMIANETRENAKDCRGVSIYFPYSVQEDENQQTKRLLGDNETGIVNLPLVKGSRDHTTKARNARIVELEADFEQLPFFKDHGWGAFIKRGWSLVLARRFPDKLDLHYSAEKVAQNLSAALDGGNEQIRQPQERNEELTKDLKQLALKTTA
jgi:chorismate mutase